MCFNTSSSWGLYIFFFVRLFFALRCKFLREGEGRKEGRWTLPDKPRQRNSHQSDCWPVLLVSCLFVCCFFFFSFFRVLSCFFLYIFFLCFCLVVRTAMTNELFDRHLLSVTIQMTRNKQIQHQAKSDDGT